MDFINSIKTDKTIGRLCLFAILLLLLSAPLLYYLTTEFYAEDMMDLIEEYQSNGTIKSNIDLKEDVAIGMAIQCVMTAIAVIASIIVTSRTVSRNYRIQKEFTENASHELQTPIAILRTQLDLLLQEELSERATRMVQEMYDTTSRMSRLNRSLLLLAKIENRQYDEKEDVDVNEMASRLSEQFSVVYPGRIRLSMPAVHIRLSANRTLLEILISNLIVNAIRHSEGGQPISASLYPGGFSVSNPAGNGSLPASDLFVRFGNHRQNPSGNGLGLAIVKQICDYNRWHVSYRYDNRTCSHLFAVDFRQRQ